MQSFEKVLGTGLGQWEGFEGGVSLVLDGGQPPVFGRSLDGFQNFVHDELPVPSGCCRVGAQQPRTRAELHSLRILVMGRITDLIRAGSLNRYQRTKIA